MAGVQSQDFYRVVTPYAVFGLLARGGVVVYAAPIARWTVGKELAYVRQYFERKGAQFELLPDEELKLRIHYGPAYSTLDFPDGRLPIDFAEAFTVKNPDYNPEYVDPDNPPPAEFEFYDTERSLLYTGLVYAAVEWARQRGLAVELVDFPFDLWKGDDPVDVPVDLIPDVILRGYQREAIAACAQRWRGIVEIATGGGKTEIAIGLILTLKKPKTVFLCPDTLSLNGMYSRFLQRGFSPLGEVGRYGDGHDTLDDDPTILVSTVQSLFQGLKKEDRRVMARLQECELFIVDECHHKATAFTWQKVGQFCQAHRRIGLSATPYKSQETRFNPARLHGHDSWLVGSIGDTIFYLPARELQESQYLAKCQVIGFEASQGNKPLTSKWSDVYDAGVVNNEGRNRQLATLAANLADMGRKPLVSVTRLEHGRIIQRMLWRVYGVHSACSYGQGVILVPKLLAEEQRLEYEAIPVYKKEKKKDLETGKLVLVKTIVGYEEDFVQIPSDVCVKTLLRTNVIRVLIGSSVYDESQDIPDLTDLINAAGGKAEQRLWQKAGRVLRLDGTNAVAWLWEPWDTSHTYLRVHSAKRIAALQEQGFPVHADWGFARIFHSFRLRDYTVREVSMKYDKLSVTTSMTIPLQQFVNVKPSVTLSASLEDGDDPLACSNQLAALTMAIFYQEAWREAQEQAAMQNGGGGWQGFFARAEAYLNQFVASRG